MADPDSSASKDLPTARGYSFVRLLGDRPVPVYAANVATKGRKLDPVVIERFARDKSIHVEDVVEFTRGARALAAAHPEHLVPLRAVVVDADAILLVGEFVDGESLSSLWRLGHDQGLAMPLEIAVRIVLDVLAGLAELHSLKDGTGTPLGMVHGELSPANVIVQTDGKAKLVHACRVKWVALKVPDSVAYLAPELLLQEGDLDHRADLYSVGSILFEAISGAPPFPKGKVSSIIRKLASGAVPRLTASVEEKWAAPLVEVVTRAMSIDRADRFDSVAQMADAIRNAVGSHVGKESQTAAWVARLAGSRILARRSDLVPPGTPRTRSRRPPPGHGLPKRVEPSVPPPAPVPSGGLSDLLAAAEQATPASDSVLRPVTSGPAEGVAVPLPVVQVGEPSRDDGGKKSASKLAPPVPGGAPVPGRAPVPIPGGAPVPIPGGAPAPIPGGAPVPMPGGAPAAGGAPVPMPGGAPAAGGAPFVAPVPAPPTSPMGLSAIAQPVAATPMDVDVLFEIEPIERSPSPTIEPLAAESTGEPTAKRRVWIFVAAAASLTLIAIGVWVLGSDDSVESSDTASALTNGSVASASTEKVVAAPPSTASDAEDAAAIDASADTPDATLEEDANRSSPTPRPPRPITRPRPGTTYEPLGI